jgi:hypothetical protein
MKSMRTYQTVPCAPKSFAARLLFPAIVLGSAIIPLAAGAQDAPKTHTLFMGADVSVGLEGKLYAVRDVSGGSWVIDVNGQAKAVSARSRPIDLKVTPSLKLTEVSATLADLKATPVYSFRSDPTTKLSKALVDAAVLNESYKDALELAQNALVQAQNLASATTGTNNQDSVKSGGIYQTPASGATNASGQTARLATALGQTAFSAGSDLEMTGDRGTAPGYDAMDVSFGVSSERRLDDPYVVTIARFHERGSDPGKVRKLVYAKALDPIDSHPRAIHILEEGFPPAFELLGVEVHLYNRAEEVATNVSSKRVELTRDEAFEYVKTVYVGAHKADTLPAVPVMGKLPADLPARLAGGKYADTIYVRVSKDGMADESFFDAACTRKVGDPYLDSVVRSIRFKPALDKGTPVDGVAPLKLGQLAI